MTGCIVVLKNGHEYDFDDCVFEYGEESVDIYSKRTGNLVSHWYAGGIAGVYAYGEGVSE